MDCDVRLFQYYCDVFSYPITFGISQTPYYRAEKEAAATGRRILFDCGEEQQAAATGKR